MCFGWRSPTSEIPLDVRVRVSCVIIYSYYSRTSCAARRLLWEILPELCPDVHRQFETIPAVRDGDPQSRPWLHLRTTCTCGGGHGGGGSGKKNEHASSGSVAVAGTPRTKGVKAGRRSRRCPSPLERWVTTSEGNVRHIAQAAGVGKSRAAELAAKLRDLLETRAADVGAGGAGVTAEEVRACVAAKRRGGARDKIIKVTPEVEEYLEELTKNPDTTSLTYAAYARLCVARFRRQNEKLTELSVSTVHRVITTKLGITLKKPIKRTTTAYTEVNIDKRRTFVHRHFANVTDDTVFDSLEAEYAAHKTWVPRRDPRLVFCLDESGFNLAALSAKRCRAPRGKRAFRHGDPIKGVNHSLLLATGYKDGVVAYGWRVEAYRGDTFVSFLEKELVPYLRRYRRRLPPSLRDEEIMVVMDNASIHKSARVAEALATVGAVPEYLPPYSPQFNPCEDVFRRIMIKSSLRRSGVISRAPPAGSSAATRSEFLRSVVFENVNKIPKSYVRTMYAHARWAFPSK